MILDVKIKTPFKGCRGCACFAPDNGAALTNSPEGKTEVTYTWKCVNENKCKYIVRKAVGDGEFERLINEVTE